MKTPIRCRYCQWVVGAVDERLREEGKATSVFCPRVLSFRIHASPAEEVRTFFFGLIKEVMKMYHETKTHETRNYSIGPSNHLTLCLALLCIPGGLCVRNAYVYLHASGFFGPGYRELFIPSSFV